jgi:hypothetical protein
VSSRQRRAVTIAIGSRQFQLLTGLMSLHFRVTGYILPSMKALWTGFKRDCQQAEIPYAVAPTYVALADECSTQDTLAI